MKREQRMAVPFSLYHRELETVGRGRKLEHERVGAKLRIDRLADDDGAVFRSGLDREQHDALGNLDARGGSDVLQPPSAAASGPDERLAARTAEQELAIGRNGVAGRCWRTDRRTGGIR